MIVGIVFAGVFLCFAMRGVVLWQNKRAARRAKRSRD